MNRFNRYLLGALLSVAALAAHGQACTNTISAPADVTSAVNAMNAGQVLCLNPGTYPGTTPGGVVFPADGSFGIQAGVIVRGLGATPAQVVLQSASASADHAVKINNIIGKNASGAQLINLTIQGAQGGVQIFNFSNTPAGRLTDIKLKDVVITTAASTSGFGVLARQADRLVMDNVTITSVQTAINFIDVTDSLVMNSTVTNTTAEAAAALAVNGGSANRFVGNTFGQPRLSAGAGYSFNGGGLVFYNTSDNRFENNVVQGVRDDAVDFTATAASPVPIAPSLNNYVGKNHVIHTAFALNGTVLGSSGIWSNCQSNGTWIYGNEVHGAAECGVCAWDAKSNMVLGNLLYNNGISGIFVSGGQESLDNCPAAQQQKPNNNFLQSNANYFNKNDQMVIRDADNTYISRSFFSANNGLGGAAQACTNAACQSAWSIETDGTAGRNTNTGTKILANTTLNNSRGIWAESSTTSGNTVTSIEMYLNRLINSTNSRWVTSTAQNIDRGSNMGGNYWTQFVPTGNPSASPYNGVFHDKSNNVGNVVDRFPYQSENLGRGYGITVVEPRAGASIAAGTKRTVRWDSVGCVFVDVALGGTTLLTAAPNTGYGVVTIPSGFAVGNATISMTCKDSVGNIRGTSTGPSVSITSSGLTLASPGRDDVFNTSASVWVGWKNPAFLSSVSIDSSLDGGANWTNLTTISGIASSNPVTSAKVTLPATGSANAMIRVRSGGTVAACGTNCDETDGVYALRGATGAFDTTNITAGRIWIMGQSERIEWSSPQGSRLVSITANGATVANDLPDRGYFDWVLPDMGVAGAMTFGINYKTITGTVIGSASVTAGNGGNSRYPTNITFVSTPAVAPGQTVPVNVTTNSGAAVTLVSSTPGTCSISGTSVTGVANGTCTITANAVGNSIYAAAPPSTISFNIGGTQTITFTAPAYIAVSSSITLNATASSGLAVVFSSLTPGVCSISGGNVLTGNSIGTCTVAANQPGNGSFAAAAQVTVNLQSMAAANIPRLANISTRMQVLTGNDVMIAGFIIGGQSSKQIVVNVAGPSLAGFGIANPLANPTVTLVRSSDNAIIASNDNWQAASNAAAIQASGFAPANPLEPAILMTLAPGAYTAIVQGAGGTTGVGLIGVFEVDHPEVPLINISTRGQVLTGNDVMIAGFIIQGTGNQTVVINVAGPSLTNFGIANPLVNPILTLVRSSDNAVMLVNDNWGTASNAAQIQASGFAPANANEPAIMLTLPPGAYTAIVQGVGNGTGVGLIGVFTAP